MPIPKTTNFGWIRDPTPEDEKRKNPLKYSFRAFTPNPLMAKISSFSLLTDPATTPPVYDQGQIGSCTANAALVAYYLETARQKEPKVSLSRLFLYYQSRLREGTVNQDAGAMIPDVMDVLRQVGVCEESLWPYDVSKFAQPPSAAANADAPSHVALDCAPVNQNLDEIKNTLMNGYMIIFGMLVFPSMMTTQVARTGMVPLPSRRERPSGGHCVAICGWDDKVAGGSFFVRNSWGTDWGLGGNFYIPYSYVLDDELCSDFWIIRGVKNSHRNDKDDDDVKTLCGCECQCCRVAHPVDMCRAPAAAASPPVVESSPLPPVAVEENPAPPVGCETPPEENPLPANEDVEQDAK